jgi:hypothetical protein
MRVRQWPIVAALALAVPGLAAAQTPDPTPVRQQQTTADDPLSGPLFDQWFAAGFIGSDFGEGAEGGNFDFGGSVGYMWNAMVGGEFLAGFTPNFQLSENLFLPGEEPAVNSYMANAIAAVPIGVDGQWQPFVSGGLGAVTLNSDVFEGDLDEFEVDGSRFGGNIGAGVMGFAGPWGLRADIRYFRAFADDDGSATDDIADSILSGLDFWRANLGVAYRW